MSSANLNFPSSNEYNKNYNKNSELSKKPSLSSPENGSLAETFKEAHALSSPSNIGDISLTDVPAQSAGRKVKGLGRKILHGTWGKDGQTDLTRAVLLGNKKEVQKLIERGAWLEEVNKWGVSPLILAIKEGKEDIEEYLLDNPQIDLNVRDTNGYTPLHWAVEKGNLASIERLLKCSDIELNIQDREGFTPLHLATELDVMKLLLSHPKIDVNAVDTEGYTALHLAADQGRKDMVELLIAHGANLNMVVNGGDTPSLVAYSAHHKELGDWLYDQSGSFERGWVAQKMLVHRFSLDLQVQSEDREINLTGFNAISSLSHLYRSLLNTSWCAQIYGEIWKEENAQMVCQIIEKAIFLLDQDKDSLSSKVQKVLYSLDNQEIVAIPTGYLGHGNAVLIWKDYLIKCDRSSKEPGLLIYQIGNRENLGEAVFRLLQDWNKTENKAYLKRGIDRELDLRRLHDIPSKEQGSDTCSWTSCAKPLFRAILYASLLRLDLEHSSALEISRHMYKEWSAQDRLLGLQEFLSAVPPQESDYFIRDKLLALVYAHLAKNPRRAELMQYVESQTPQELIEQVQQFLNDSPPEEFEE